MKNLETRTAICPRENVKRMFVPTDRFARQFGITYECQSCGQVVNEAYLDYQSRMRGEKR